MIFLLGFILNLSNSTSPINECSPTDSLTVRNAHGMAYNEHQKEIMLFGGADEHQVLADLWTWDGTQWRCLAKGGPSARTFPVLAYDSGRQRLLLFGGNSVLFGSAEEEPVFLNDMWAWDGQRWQLIEAEMPSARAEASAAYDSKRQRLVLYGGYRIHEGEIQRLGDTWEWDGHEWHRVSTDGPSARHGAAMAYDSRREQVVLFGGNGAMGDTWEWDGNQWKEIATAQTPGRFNSAMTYDAERGVMIRFGGWNGQDRVGDTWSYNGIHWNILSKDGPNARNHTLMVYDRGREAALLFGGHDGPHVFGDTWEWNGSSWSQLIHVTPRLRQDNGH